MSDDPKDTDTPRPIHDVSQFTSAGEWYRAHIGRVPLQMAAGLQRLMEERQCTFPEAYRLLVGAGKIIEITGPAAGSKTPAGKE